MADPKKQITVLDNMKDIQHFLRSAGPTIVMVWFTRSGCGASREVEKRMHRVLTMYPKLPIVKVDVEGNTEVASKFDVQFVPYFIFFRKNRKVDSILCSKIDLILEKIQEVHKKFPPKRVKQEEVPFQPTAPSTSNAPRL